MSRISLRKTGVVSHRVGLDIGCHSVKGVEVVGQGLGAVIRSAGLSIIPHPARASGSADRRAIIQSIRGLWSNTRFQTRKVVLALPASTVYTNWVDIEVSDDVELDAISRSTAANGAPFPAHEAIVDYRILACRTIGSRKVYSTMLVAAHSVAVDSALDLAEDAGLEPVAVDIGFAASLRGLRVLMTDDNHLCGDQPSAHCIIGARSTTITVARGEQMEFARTVPVGGDDFTRCVAKIAKVDWTIADRLKMDLSTRMRDDGTIIVASKNRYILVPCADILSRLSTEISRSLRCFSSHFAEGSYLGAINGLTLSGGSSLLKGIDVALGQHGVKINGVTNPFSGVSIEGKGVELLVDQSPAFTTAMGLALGDYWGENSYQVPTRQPKDYFLESCSH